jgi:uncharacterized protein
MNKNLQWVLIIIGAVFLILSFRFPSSGLEEGKIVREVHIGGSTLNVEEADTPEARTQGLSGRPTLQTEDSMLFIFDEPGIYSFWMKDMNFSIDIFWIDENLRVVYMKENASLASYPESFKPATPVKYVLETVAGFAEKNGIKIGDRVRFDY